MKPKYQLSKRQRIQIESQIDLEISSYYNSYYRSLKVKTVTRVSKEFAALRKIERKAKQIKSESYLESISTYKPNLFKEIYRKGTIIF